MIGVLSDVYRLRIRANEVTPTDQNPILQVTTWLLLSINTLLLGFRQLTRFYIKAGKPFGWEDALIIVSYLIGVGEYITVLLPEGRAIGRDIKDISNAELTAAEKASYARDLLFIICLGCSKLSVSTSLLILSPKRTHRRVLHGLQFLTVGWMISSFFAIAFQCGAHGPWENGIEQCGDQQSILTYVAIVNILTDAALIGIPVTIIYPLKMTMRVRATVLAFYMIRILVVVATIIQLVYLPRLFHKNYTLRSFPYYISMQLVQFTSITASCAVYFWPLFQSLQSGLMLATSPEQGRQHTSPTQTKKSTLPYSQPSMVSQESSKRDRSGYIEITTDIDIRRAEPPEGGVPANTSAWELKELQRGR